MAKSAWQIEQGKECTCKGYDEYCPCQNVNRSEAPSYPNKALTAICTDLLDEWELTPDQIANLALDIPGECKAIAENRAEAAYEREQQSLMESGGPDDSAYRRDMIAAGRGHLLR